MITVYLISQVDLEEIIKKDIKTGKLETWNFNEMKKEFVHTTLSEQWEDNYILITSRTDNKIIFEAKGEKGDLNYVSGRFVELLLKYSNLFEKIEVSFQKAKVKSGQYKRQQKYKMKD